jgi:anaerobic ribonucleoside-triphosphate reductase
MKSYSEMYVSGNPETGNVFLTSGFLPPFQEEDLLKQIDVSCHFQSYATGGSILHLFLGEEINVEKKVDIIKKLTSTPLQYFTLTSTLMKCNNCKEKIVGKHNVCPKCKSKDVTLWSRPIGYFRPVLRDNITGDFTSAKYQYWTKPRVVEFSQRRLVVEDDYEALLDM